MTFVNGARSTETPQCCRMGFITIQKEKFSAATETCSVTGYCHAQLADYSTLQAHRMQNFTTLLAGEYIQ